MLQRKLEAIKDLKRQYYVGTGEAKAYLDAVAGMPECRTQVAKHLNRRTGTPATEEDVLRISGMLDVMDEKASEYAYEAGIPYHRLGFAAWSSTFQEPDHDPTDPDQNIHEIPPAWEEFAGQGYVLDDHYERFRVLIPLLQESARTDETSFYTNLIQQTAVRIYQSAVLDGQPEIDAQLKAQDFLATLDTDEVLQTMHGQGVGELEMNVRDTLARQHISHKNIAERLARDQLLHRHEYRRQVATLYADRSEATSADEVLETARSDLERAIQREERSPQGLRPMYRQTRQTHEEVARILASEKNYLDRYMR